MDVAIEGAAEADRVVLPVLVGPKVEAKLCPAVPQTQAKGRLHLQEHGRQLLDVEQVCGSGVRRKFRYQGIYVLPVSYTAFLFLMMFLNHLCFFSSVVW